MKINSNFIINIFKKHGPSTMLLVIVIFIIMFRFGTKSKQIDYNKHPECKVGQCIVDRNGNVIFLNGDITTPESFEKKPLDKIPE